MTWELGCLIDEHWGWKANAWLAWCARPAGFEVSDEDTALLARFIRGDYSPDATDGEWEAVNDLAAAAEDYLNEHHAPEGASFGWFDGGFYLWDDGSWQAVC